MSASLPSSSRRWPKSATIVAILAALALAFVVIVVIYGYGRGGNREPAVSPLPAEGRVDLGPSPTAPAVQGVGRYIVRRGEMVTLEHDGKTWIRIGPHRLANAVVGDLYATREDPDLRLIELRDTTANKPRYRLERYDDELEWVMVD